MINVVCLKNQFGEFLAGVPDRQFLVTEHNIPGVELIEVPTGIFGCIRWRSIIIRAKNQSVHIYKSKQKWKNLSGAKI